MSFPLRSIRITDETGTNYTDLFADIDLDSFDLLGDRGIRAVDAMVPNSPHSPRAHSDGPLGAVIVRWIQSRVDTPADRYGWQYLGRHPHDRLSRQRQRRARVHQHLRPRRARPPRLPPPHDRRRPRPPHRVRPALRGHATMSTLDLFDDSFPHGTPDGYRRGCKTIACPALIPCRTAHTRYSGDYTFARMIDAGMSLSEILEQDAAAKEGIHQRDSAAARQQQRVAAPTHRAAAKPKTAVRPNAAPHPGAHASPAVAQTPIRPLRPHPGYEWLTRAAAGINSVPDANRAQRQRDLADYRTALDHHVTELEQWRQEHADLRRQLAAAAAALKTVTSPAAAAYP